MIQRQIISVLLLWICSAMASAHEVRPGYLEIQETTAEQYEILWKVPMRGGAVMRLSPRFPDSCSEPVPRSSRQVAAAQVSQWTVVCTEGLQGKSVVIEGLEQTLTDVLARVTYSDGTTQTTLISPKTPDFTISGQPSAWQVVKTYLVLGIEHILGGIDHLLFVFALLLIVRGWRLLVATITAFTVAHSITLAAATLGFVNVPQAPVEAVIALSILFLASEIIHMRRGRSGLAQRSPWLVAFIFGLLHGFGFAGALSEVGLPPSDIPLALVFFNIGVEVGQLLFVGCVYLAGTMIQKLKWQFIRRGELLVTYVIGSAAAFWTIERALAF